MASLFVYRPEPTQRLKDLTSGTEVPTYQDISELYKAYLKSIEGAEPTLKEFGKWLLDL